MNTGLYEALLFKRLLLLAGIIVIIQQWFTGWNEKPIVIAPLADAQASDTTRPNTSSIPQEMTYEDYLLHDLNFAVEYISLHYPFSGRQMRLYMQHLKKGDAYYPIYEKDTNNLKVPELGLCFNNNISWTDELRAEWPTNSAEGSIPLSVEIFVDKYHQYMWEWDLSNHEYTEYELLNMEYDHVPHEILHPVTYPHLSPAELFNCNRQEILYNESIWENTLKDVVTTDIVELLIHAKKHRVEQQAIKEPRHVEFPEFHIYMEQMQPDHDNDPCYAAFNLFEYLFGNSNAGDAKTLNALAQKWETSVKKITQHMDCVHAFLEKGYPDVLRVIEIRNEQEATGIDEDDDHEHDDDYFSKEQYHKYNGYNDWPDQAIDEAFEGDPEATWNVD